jgi:hypothetical protein
MKKILFVVSVLLATSARADWHTGSVTSIGFGYDASTIVFKISGLTKTSCTCYSAWPSYLCIDKARDSWKEEFALLLKASATKELIEININETTCKPIAVLSSESN